MDADNHTVQCPLCRGARTRTITLKNGEKEERRCFLCAGVGQTLWKTAVAFRRWKVLSKKKLSSKTVKPDPESE